ncbi:hypothetical protein [Flavobacterium selenitireducens]|uniref:hypothetical protein n=1 Tax=Flavobacterium selenitireducens TaxID=2722704 RepID=UPI00168A8FBB|nr:hypothetical protein [Flavobacterium selenitireducens]MBD3583776.1 hypothetical protein [Flavobacterium selenitireducens]
MSKQGKNLDDQEIDLAVLKQKMSSAVDGFNYRLFRMLQFVIRNIIILGLLFVIGVGLGIYLDRTQKIYDHEVVVQPNFGSVDYLYAKINLLDSKIQKGDTAFLKAIGIKYPKKLLKMEIKPIVEVYPFAGSSELNFELLKVMAEDGTMKKVIEEPATARNYPRHTIYFTTKHLATRENIIQPLMDYLNNSAFYSTIKVEYIKNLKIKMEANDRIIAQIDGILDSYASSSTGKSPGMVYYNNENNQINDVIESKDKLVREQGDLRVLSVSYDKIVKDQNTSVNIENTEVTSGKMKLFLPLLFIGLFVIVRMFISFYKKQSLKTKQEQL